MDCVMSNLVSIIIPVYNVEKYIRKALLSVINQTYKNIEIIVVNDGTKDRSIDIIQDLVMNDSRITVIQRQNGGLSAARNTGLKVAQGDFVLFFDSDDTISENLVEIALRRAEDTEADVVVFGFENLYCDNDENVYASNKFQFENVLISDTRKISDVPKDFLKSIGYAWNKLYRTTFLKNNDYYFEEGLSLVEDVVFNHKVFTGTDNISFLSGTYYQYYTRDRVSLSNKFYDNFIEIFKKGFLCRTEILNKIYPNANNDLMLSANFINGIRYYCYTLIRCNKGKSKKEIIKQLNKILDDNVTREQVKIFSPNNIKDSIFVYCINHHHPLLLYMIYKIKRV